LTTQNVCFVVTYSSAVCFRKFWSQLPEEAVPSGLKRVEK